MKNKSEGEAPVLKSVKTKWRIDVMQVTDYLGAMVMIRHIRGSGDPKSPNYGDLFEYVVFWDGKIYANHMVFTAPKAGRKLTKREINMGFKMIFAGAQTTVEMLMGVEPKEKELGKEAT